LTTVNVKCSNGGEFASCEALEKTVILGTSKIGSLQIVSVDNWNCRKR